MPIIEAYFNSRLRKETNYHAEYISRNVDHISIHVSARRRTIQEYCRRIWGVISIHVSLRRRTPLNALSSYSCFISTHVSLRRRTHKLTLIIILFIFQLTSPQGDEPSGMFSFSQLRYFNSRLREETNILCDWLSAAGQYISTHVSVGRRTEKFGQNSSETKFQLTSP